MSYYLQTRMVLPRAAWGVLGLVASGCGRAVLTAEDAIVLEHEPAELVAFAEREQLPGLGSDLERVTIRFIVEGREVGRTKADDEERASISLASLKGDARCFEVEATFDRLALRGAAGIYRWRKDQTIIAVDIDDTISDTDFDKLILKDDDAASRPVTGARKALAAMAKDYQICYLTARPRFLLERTRRWIADNGFPAGPVITAPGVRSTIRQERFKRTTLARLRDQSSNLLVGIGNDENDAEALAANRMLPIILDRKAAASHYPRYAVLLSDWRTVSRFFEANHDVLIHPNRLRDAIDHQGMFLQPVLGYEPGSPKRRSDKKPREVGGVESK